MTKKIASRPSGAITCSDAALSCSWLREVLPVTPYRIAMPYTSIAEENALIKNNLIAASLERSLCRK